VQKTTTTTRSQQRAPSTLWIAGKIAHCGMRCTACSMNSATCLVMFSSALRCGKLSPPLSIAKQISHVFSLIMSVWACVHTDLDNFRLQWKRFTRLTTLSWDIRNLLKKLPFVLPKNRFPTHLIEKVINKYVSPAQSSRPTQATRKMRSPLIFTNCLTHFLAQTLRKTGLGSWLSSIWLI